MRFAILCSILLANPAAAGPRVDVVVGPQAPKLEQFAAGELQRQLRQLFDADVHVGKDVPREAKHLILLGSPATNPAVKNLAGSRWPKMSDQGHVLRSIPHGEGAALLVGGGSPVATLWAVYEFGHHFGIRPFLHGDVPPMESPALRLDGIDRVLEPTARVRAWQTMDASPFGGVAWGLADQKRLIDQLAKLRFNRLFISVRAWQPFAPFEFDGVTGTMTALWKEPTLKVSGDTAGRPAFRGADVFENPDVGGKGTEEDRLRAGTELLRGLIDAAHARGIRVALSFCPLEFPGDFANRLPGARTPDGRSYYPAVGKGPGDEALLAHGLARLRTYRKRYPGVEVIGLELPPVETGREKVIHRIAQAASTDDGGTEVVVVAVDQGAGPSGIPGPLVKFLPLGRPSPLPQLRTTAFADLSTGFGRGAGGGWGMRGWVIGDTSPTVYFASRASFEPKLTPQAAYEQLLTPICGEGVAERIGRGFDLVEQAGELFARNDPGFDLPGPDLVKRHYAAKDVPDWLPKAIKLYAGATDEMYRGNTRARGGARPVLVYHAKRMEFAAGYLRCLEAVRRAAIARDKGDDDEHLEQLEKSIDAIYGALGAFGDVARDPSDRGAIAVVNEYVYRPLQAVYARAKKKG